MRRRKRYQPVGRSRTTAAPRRDSPTPDATADRPVDEPEDATQQDQFDQLSETVNDRRDMSEEEEAELLQAEFGPPDATGIYGAPRGVGMRQPQAARRRGRTRR